MIENKIKLEEIEKLNKRAIAYFITVKSPKFKYTQTVMWNNFSPLDISIINKFNTPAHSFYPKQMVIILQTNIN